MCATREQNKENFPGERNGMDIGLKSVYYA